jgi:pimeloyl-ACP methyl ester carboxylesterase
MTALRRAALAVALAAVGFVVVHPAATAATRPPVDARYAVNGPATGVHEVVVDRATGAAVYEVFAPKDLGPPGTRHPIVTWGNGSFAHPVEYDALLRHLATWGFVVVAADTDQSGTGDEILAATRAVLSRDANPRSRFAGHLATDRVGAGGHSQGAGGAVRATVRSSGLISTVLLADLPNPLFTFPPDAKEFAVGKVTVPVFFLAGVNDTVISSAALNRAFFDHVPAPAAMGLLKDADHNTVQHDAAGYRGYITAWYRYRLMDDPVAARAFTGPHPELLTNPAWQDQALRSTLP